MAERVRHERCLPVDARLLFFKVATGSRVYTSCITFSAWAVDLAGVSIFSFRIIHRIQGIISFYLVPLLLSMNHLSTNFLFARCHLI
jgi:hypothetical protein